MSAHWPCPDCNGTGTIYTRHGPSDWDMDPCERCGGLGTLPWSELTVLERSRWREQWAAHMQAVHEVHGISYYLGFAESRAEWDERDEEALNDGVLLPRTTHLWPTMSSTPRRTPPWIALCGAPLVDSIFTRDGDPVRYDVHWVDGGDRVLCVECEVKWTEAVIDAESTMGH